MARAGLGFLLLVSACAGEPRERVAPRAQRPIASASASQPQADVAPPSSPANGPKALQVAVARGRSCALLEDRSVACWGGRGGSKPAVVTKTPKRVSGLASVRAIAIGDFHSCALLETGKVTCWGDARSGRLGDGSAVFDEAAPESLWTAGGGEVKGVERAIEIAVSTYHACARLEDGSVACWGEGTAGELGFPAGKCDQNGSFYACSTTAKPVLGVKGAAAIAIGNLVSCARLGDGTVACWGDNTTAGLGDGTTSRRTTPSIVSGLSGVRALSVGSLGACAITADAKAECWGALGSLASAAALTSCKEARLSCAKTPIAIPTLAGALDLSMTTGGCARFDGGTLVKCWDLQGEPEAVADLGRAVQVASSGEHACAIGEDGAVRCWGKNDVGELGDGTTVARKTPAIVSF